MKRSAVSLFTLLALGAGAADAQPKAKAKAGRHAQATAQAKAKPQTRAKAPAKPTLVEAKRFLAHTEAAFDKLNADQARAEWVGANFITDDTEAIAAYFGELQLDAAGQAALAARVSMPAVACTWVRNGASTTRSASAKPGPTSPRATTSSSPPTRLT